MALELTSLVFKTETSDLERASKVIGELVTNVGKLDKAARDAAQTEATLARAAKDNAKANLDNAKAQDVRLKSTITADKADQQAAGAIEKKTKATEKATEASAKNIGVLQRQKDILEFQTQGFSRGQSSILSYGKAAGLAAEDIGELGKVLETQRKLMGGDPFDKSLSGLKSLRNQFTELKESVRQYATDFNLTAKQTRELARDKERLIEKMKVEGASFSEIRQAVRAHNTEYVNLATSYNKMTSAEDAVIKSRKEAVNATNYLTQADQKMAAALNTSNAALDKAGTDSLVKYETALRKSGVSQDVATQKLATYKAQLAQVAAVEEKRRAQHLTRALTPQISDVAVSLWSGQSPLTVLLQQGAQINDMFQLSGVAAADFGKTVKEAFSSMLPSILTVVKGVGGLLVDGFMAAGRAVLDFAGKITGITTAMDALHMKMTANGPSQFIGWIQKAGLVLTGVFAVGIAVVVAGLVGLGIGLKQVIEENDNLARSMAQSGASMAISTSQAFAYAKSMNDVDISTGKAVVAITEMAKAGNFASSDIPKVTEAAVNLNKYLGVSIEDTVKAYSKLKDEPVKAILDLAKASGNIPPKIIETIVELERQGEVAKATSLAMTARFENDKKVIEDAKKNLSGFSTFVISLGNTISNFFSNTFKNIWYATDPTDELQKNLDEVRKKIKDVSATLESNKSWGISGDPKLLNSLKEQERMIISQIGAQVRLRGEEEKRKFLNAENAKYESAIAGLRGNALDAIEKETRKTQTLAEFRKSFINDKLKEAAKEKSVDIEKLKLNTDLMNVLQQQADIEYKKTQKSGSKSENYYATLMREATNNTIAANTAAQELTKSEQKLLEVRSDPRFEKLTATQKQDVISKYEAAIAAEKQTVLTEKLAEAEEHRLKLLGKSEGIGKQYYSDMQKLEEFAKVAGWSREEIEELTRAVFMATPAWKAYEKALEDVNSAARKFNEDSIASQAATLKENESLDYRLSLLGKTAEEQRALSIEYNRANKISEVRIKLAKQLRDIEADIEKAKKAGLPEEKYKNLIDAQVQARKDAAEQEKVINREVVVQYKEDFQKEFDAIKNGISDSIVTALFEGGKAGSKKLRDLVMAELRKPVTMVVNAVVNTLLGNILGSLMGGAAAGAAGGAAGGIAGSIGSSVAGSAIMSGVGMMGTEGLANIVGFLGGDALGVLGAGASGGFSSAIAAAIGQIPVWGWIAGGLAAIASMLDDSGTYHTGGAARYSKGGGLTSGNSGAAFDIGFGQVETGKETISAMETLSKSLVEIFDGIAKTFGKTAGYEVAVAFADDTSDDGAWGAFGVRLQGVEILNWDDFRQSKWAPKEFGDGEEGYKQYLAAIAKDTRQVILDMDLPSWADQVLNDIGDAPSLESLSKAIQELAQMKSMYDLMTSQMVNFAGITDEAFGKLIKEFGDIGTMTNQVTGYYQNYYSEFERFNKAQADVTKSFTDLGLTMPTSREEFRKLAESQDLNTEAGRKMYAQLMALAASFGVVIDATEQLANARTDIVYRMMEQEALLLEAQGRSAEADKKRRELLDKQRGAEYERLMKINPELARLTAELWALEDAAVAAAKVKEIADTRQDLTDRILQQEAELLDAQGRTAEADKKRRELLDRQRARENERLMALNPELAKLAYELWLLEDATAAATRAAKERKEISNDLYNALEKAVAAEKTLLNEQKARLEETVSTLKAVFDILKSSVEDLYGEVSSTAAMQASEGRGVIAQAIATGILPDSKLLDTSIQAVRDEISNSLYVSKADADKARLIFAAQLALLKGTTEEQLTDAEKQLKAVNAQISYLDNILKTAKEQLDAFLGNTDVLKSVDKALADLYAFLQNPSAAKPTPIGSGGNGSGGNGTGGGAVFGPGTSTSKPSTENSDGNIVYADGSIGYRNSWIDNSGVKHYGFVSKDIWETERARGTTGYPAFANGGYYQGGMALVGEEGPELINFSNPGQVYTAKQTASMLSGESSEVVAELKAVRSEIIMLRAEVRADVSHNAKTAKLLDRVIPEGDSVQVTIS